MSNSITPGSSAAVNVNVTALTTNPNVPVTYKTIILKKNLVNGVNTLTQNMMLQSNVKYVIKYDFILDPDATGGTITIPQGCILEFDGGSLSEQILAGQDTIIIAQKEVIFDNIDIAGTWKINTIYDAWFKTANAKSFKACIALLSNIIYNEIIIEKDYDFETVVTEDTSTPYFSIPQNTKVRIDGSLSVSVGPDVERYKFIQVNGSDVTICGNGQIVGDKGRVTPSKSDLPTDHTYEWLHGIAITSGLSNVTIKGLKITKFKGDGIWQGDAGEPSQFITIADCNIYECRRQGITIENACNVWIENNHIHEISGKNPQSAIDLEPSLNSQEVKDVTIIGNKIENCGKGFLAYASSVTLNVKDIRFVKNVICINDATLRTTSPIMACYYTYDCCIDSNHIYTTQGTTTSSECLLWGCKNISFINNKWEINGTLYDVSNKLVQILTSAEGIIITGNVFKVASTNPLMWLAFHSAFGYPDVIIKDNNYKEINASNPLPEIIGAEIYDTTNKKPLWWNGTAWVDATGTQV